MTGTEQTDQGTEAARRIAMARRAYELAVEVGDEDFVVITEEIGAVLAALDSETTDRDRLAARVAELEGERERIRAVTAEWHRAAISQHDGLNWTIAGHALAMVLHAIDDKPTTSDAGESGDETRPA